MANVPAAVVAMLLAKPAVTAIAGTRVFAPELPRHPIDYALSMPNGTVIVTPAGGGAEGLGRNSYVPLVNVRVDVRCYGEDWTEAALLHDQVKIAFKYLRRSTFANTLLDNSTVVGGPVYLREPDANWPFVYSVYNVQAHEETP